MSRRSLHMLPAAAWAERDPTSAYAPPTLAAEGFIHCTDGDDGMMATANRFYRDDPRPFVVLTLDLETTGSPWRFDDPDRRFPHVYGTIDPRAVLGVRRLVRDPDGLFTGITGLED